MRGSSLHIGQHVAPGKYYLTNCFDLWCSHKGHWFTLHCVLLASANFPPLTNSVNNISCIQVLACFSDVYLCHPLPDFSPLGWCCVHVSVGRNLDHLKSIGDMKGQHDKSVLWASVCVWLAELSWPRKTNRECERWYLNSLKVENKVSIGGNMSVRASH